MTLRLNHRETRAYVVVTDETEAPLVRNEGKLAPDAMMLRWLDDGDGWKLMDCKVSGTLYRQDGTVGQRTGTVDYADPWSPSGWHTGAPEWVKLAARRLDPVTLNTTHEFKPKEA